MKTVMTAFLALTLLTQTARAETCADIYQSQKHLTFKLDKKTLKKDALKIGAAAGSIGLIGGALYAAEGLAFESVLVLAVGSTVEYAFVIGVGFVAVAGAVDGVESIHNARLNKMIHLIKQSDAYLQDETSAPGKLLVKTLAQINKNLDASKQLTLESLAQQISYANKLGTQGGMCGIKKEYASDLQKRIENGELKTVDLDK